MEWFCQSDGEVEIEASCEEVMFQNEAERSVIARLLLSRCLRREKKVIGGKPALNHL